MLRRLLPLAFAALAASPAFAAKARRTTAPAFDCAGTICVDADTGKVLSEQTAGRQNPPASVTKLMTLLVVQDELAAGRAKLTDTVTADKEAWKFIGSKVALNIGEQHSLDDMLYALMVQSANDGSIAIAKHISGTTAAFVAKMNARAAALGMTQTRFTSPHGYPAGRSREDDISTARDLSLLARELLKNPLTLKYSSTKTYRFRPGNDLPGTYNNLSNHNKLLWSFSGCDGLKTGWSGAGASIVTTASRGGKRVIAVVLGGKVPAADGTPQAAASQLQCRNRAAALMEEGLATLGVAGAPATAVTAKPGIAPAPVAVNGSAPEAVPAVTATGSKSPATAAKAPVKTKDGAIHLNW